MPTNHMVVRKLIPPRLFVLGAIRELVDQDKDRLIKRYHTDRAADRFAVNNMPQAAKLDGVEFGGAECEEPTREAALCREVLIGLFGDFRLADTGVTSQCRRDIAVDIRTEDITQGRDFD